MTDVSPDPWEKHREIGSTFWEFYEHYNGHPFEDEKGRPEMEVQKRLIETQMVFAVDILKCMIGLTRE